MHKFNSVKETLSDVFSNFFKLLRFSAKADAFLTIGYYVTAGINALFPVIISYSYKLLVDNTIKSQGISPSIPVILVATLGGYYLVVISQSLIRYGLQNVYFDYLLRYKLQNAINYEFYKKVSSLDLAHLENPKTEDLIQKAKDTMTWRVPDFLRQFSYVFTSLITYISAFIILIPYGIAIPTVLTLIALPRLIARLKFGRIVWSIYGAETPEARKMWYLGWLLADKTALQESKIFQSTEAVLGKLKKLQDKLYEENKKPVDKYLRIVALPEVLETGLTFLIAIMRISAVTSGQMTVGDFTFFISILSRLVDGSVGIVLEFGEVYADNLYVKHFFEVLGLKELVEKPINGIRISDYSKPPRIEFKNVFFKYPNTKKLVLRNINFVIEPGENAALVGVNGAGKTTIVKLLCRFYDVTSGEILINGINIKELDLNDWYRHIGTLFQEFIRYDFTVKENIMLGNPSIYDEAKMIRAAKKARAHKFINELEDGYDQLLGRQFEGGAELSIGQWQKIAIARALYEEAPVLILDEPTSAIDAEAEYKIFKNLNKTYRNKSLLFISHRFSTVRNANKILVIKNGEIAEEGSHVELIKKGELYKEMFEKQAIGYK